jgi:hypothetical protein
MAQDSSLRREAAPASSGHGNDPLAELARLIGQNDPFAEGSGKAAPSTSRATPRPQAAAPQEAPEWLSRPSAAGGQADYYSQAPQSGYQDPNDQYQQYQDDPRYQDPQYDQAGHQGAYAGEGGTQDPAYGYQEEAYYDDQQQGYDESGYDPPPAEKRRGGLMTVLAVVVLAVVGTAAAFGYRAWTGPSATTGEPPVIKAEQTPTKVVPATPSGDAQLSKQVYDRVGDRGGERMVPREEQPIDPRSAARPPSGAQTGVLPPLGGPTPIAAGDPKPVKTVTIRPDQAGAAAAQPQVVRPPAAGPAAGAPPPAPTRVPTTSIQSAPPPAPRAQTAAVGSNFVQVSSQLSESDAQASFRMLQSKYPSQLGDQKVVIQKADLTAHGKGVVYRAMVGPFASREEATQLCMSLKNAGGQCVLHSTQ